MVLQSLPMCCCIILRNYSECNAQFGQVSSDHRWFLYTFKSEVIWELMSGHDLSVCQISQFLPARFYNIAKVLQFTGEAGKAEWRYRRYRKVKYVSLLMWCWDWVQGGDPLYAAVFCLSSCHGHMFQHFEDKKLAQSNQFIPQQWSEEITERADGQ